MMLISKKLTLKKQKKYGIELELVATTIITPHKQSLM